MMSARKVMRSTTAAARRGSVKVAPHSQKLALVATATEARSSRSVMTWNNSSAPRGSRLTVAELVQAQQFQAPVAADEPGQTLVRRPPRPAR